ncbi:MAG: hypothetical protein AAFP84_15615, partial [Actinomycetota bacterium]
MVFPVLRFGRIAGRRLRPVASSCAGGVAIRKPRRSESWRSARDGFTGAWQTRPSMDVVSQARAIADEVLAPAAEDVDQAAI